jgi:AmmeMemoRadiSam system protein B
VASNNQPLKFTFKNNFLLADLDFEEEEKFVEINLPFLQFVLKKPFEIIPIYMGALFDEYDRIAVTTCLEEHFNREDSMFVVCSNLVRWGEQFCFTYKDPKLLQTFLSVEAVLKEINALVEAQRPEKLEEYVEEKKANIEGKEVLMTLMNVRDYHPVGGPLQHDSPHEDHQVHAVQFRRGG